MTMICPQCHRKLLSHTSASCNWCGHEIADPEYQARAEAGRAAFFAHQAAHDAASLMNIEMLQAGSYIPQPDPFTNGVWGQIVHQHRMEAAIKTAASAAIAERRAIAAQAAAKSLALSEASLPETVSGTEDQERFKHLEL